MRAAVTIAVLLAVLATALVAVCQHSETRRLQYRVWQLERRRERLERKYERLARAIAATRTPRRLLSARDGRPPAPPAAPEEPSAAPAGGPWVADPGPGGPR
jgi:hypothetical protein